MHCRTVLFVVLALAAGCDKKREQQEAAKAQPSGSAEATTPKTANEARSGAPTPDGYVPIPDTDLVVKLPAGVDAKPMDGIPGFANADKSFAFIVRQLDPSEKRTVDELKTKIKDVVKEFDRQETTPDGFILTFTSPKTEMVQDPDGRVHSKEVGIEYGLQMRFQIDGTPYKCACNVPKKETLQLVIDACKSIKKK